MDNKHITIPFSRPTLGTEEEEAAIRVLRSGWLAPGPETEAFEQEFSDYISPPGEHYYCIFTNSCTSALKMSYKWALEAGIVSSYGDIPYAGHFKYLCYPENTFCATYSAGEEMGVNMRTYDHWFGDENNRVNMHYGGVKDETPCLIEDSAHRIEPNDPLVGKIRCYSFYVTKNMTSGGAGGMVIVKEKEDYEKLRKYWRDGLTTSTRDRLSGVVDYEVAVSAGGYDAPDLAAAVGRVQLRKLPDFTARRNEGRDRYNTAFGRHWLGNHLYCLDLGTESRVRACREFLWEQGIGSGYHYPGTGWTSISLPLYPLLTEIEQDYIITTMRKGGYA